MARFSSWTLVHHCNEKWNYEKKCKKRRTFDKITAAKPMNRAITKLSPRIIKPNRTFFTVMAPNEVDGKIQEVMRLTFF